MEPLSRTKRGQRVYLNDVKTRDLVNELHGFFASYIDVPRMRVGKQQTIETMIHEEASILAKYLRSERKRWMPRLFR
jgi:hypothetical protein